MNQTPTPAAILDEIQSLKPAEGYPISPTCLRWIHNLQERPHVRGEVDRVLGPIDLGRLGTFYPAQFLQYLQALAQIVATKEIRGFEKDLRSIRFILRRGVPSPQTLAR